MNSTTKRPKWSRRRGPPQTSNPTSPAKAVFNSRFKHVGAEIRAGLNYEFEWLHREPAWSADDAKPSRRPRFGFLLPTAHKDSLATFVTRPCEVAAQMVRFPQSRRIRANDRTYAAAARAKPACSSFCLSSLTLLLRSRQLARLVVAGFFAVQIVAIWLLPNGAELFICLLRARARLAQEDQQLSVCLHLADLRVRNRAI